VLARPLDLRHLRALVMDTPVLGHDLVVVVGLQGAGHELTVLLRQDLEGSGPVEQIEWQHQALEVGLIRTAAGCPRWVIRTGSRPAMSIASGSRARASL